MLIYDPEKDGLRCACRDYAAWLAEEDRLPVGEKTAPVRITLRSEQPVGILPGAAVFGAVIERLDGGYRAVSHHALGDGTQDLVTFDYEFADDEIDQIRARLRIETHGTNGKGLE